MSGFFDWISGKDPNKDLRAADYATNHANRERRGYDQDIIRDNYHFRVDQQEAQKNNTEANLRFQEEELQRSYEFREELRQYDFDQKNRAYDQSLSQKIGNDNFANLAFKISNREQDVYRDEQLQSLLFNQQDSVLDYMAKTSGLKQEKAQNTLNRSSKSAELRLTRDNAMTDARFGESAANLKYESGAGKAKVTRRMQRGAAQFKTNNAILEGMKAAGKAKVTGGAGRSNAKAVQGIIAESGARQAAIANELMFAEQGIDLDLAILKDQLIYDQAMVTSARDRAQNSFSLSQAAVNANADLQAIGIDTRQGFADRNFEVNQQKISASRVSLGKRDSVVREGLQRDYDQALADNEAALMLKPEIYPAYNNPKEYLKQFDDEGNEIGWGLPRPEYPKIPMYRELPMPAEVKGARVPTGWAAAPGIIAEGAAIAAGVVTGIGALPGVTLGAGAVNAANVLGTISNFGNILGGNKPTYTPMTIGTPTPGQQTPNNQPLPQEAIDLFNNFFDGF